MTNEEIIEMAKLAGWEMDDSFVLEPEIVWYICQGQLELFAKLIAEKEREALEVELLKLKQGVVANSDYIQGRWDLIGEFQDIIRARGQE